jgi:chromosome segregation ATPase
MKPLNLALSTLLAAGAAAVVAVPSSAIAQYPPGYGQPTGPNPALVEAKKQIQLAEKDVVRIRQDMQKIKSRIQSRYEGKEEWEEAQKALKTAEANQEAARKKAMAKLVGSADYKAAKEKQSKADALVQKLNAEGAKADPKALAAAQQERIDSALTVRRHESEVMDNDPKVLESKTKVAEAKKAWDALEDELKQALEQDPDYQAAEQELQTAQANVTQMKQSLQQQVASEREAKRAAQQSQRQSRSPRGGGGYGGGGYGGGRR